MNTLEDLVFTVFVFVCIVLLFRVLIRVIWKATWTPENNRKWGEFGRSVCGVALSVFILSLGLKLLGFPSYWFLGIFPLPLLVGILVVLGAFYIYGEIIGGLK